MPPTITLTEQQQNYINHISRLGAARKAAYTTHTVAAGQLRATIQVAAATNTDANPTADIVAAVDKAVTRQAVHVTIDRAGADRVTAAWNDVGQPDRATALDAVRAAAGAYRETMNALRAADTDLLAAMETAQRHDTPASSIVAASLYAEPTGYDHLTYVRNWRTVRTVLANSSLDNWAGDEVLVAGLNPGRRIRVIVGAPPDSVVSADEVRRHARMCARRAVDALARAGFEVNGQEAFLAGEYGTVRPVAA
jgi:hypothetical protein